MSDQSVWSLAQLTSAELGRVVVWASPSVHQRVQSALPWPTTEPEASFPVEADALVVVGGGTLIDRAKALRQDAASRARLIAIPSIWGSGAEASPIAVLTHADRKEIRKDPSLLPDVRVVWPELAASLPSALAMYGCGDAWTHAMEGFLSPLAGDNLRGELAGVLADLAALPLANDPRWFEVSARACAAQARSSVGLVHGIAHTLEPVLHTEQPDAGWGHARLCSTFLWPVLRLGMRTSSKASDLAAQYGVDLGQIESTARSLFDERAYDAALPSLQANWTRVLRDPCTRTNSTLVRGEHLAFFAERAFL